MEQNTQFVLLEIEKSIAYLTLNRPEKNNAFNQQMIAEIKQSVAYCSQFDGLRALVIQQNGKHFSAGADLQYMKSMSEESLQENKKDSEQLFELFQSIYQCPIPTIALIQGASYGGSNGIIACCDFALASTESSYSFSEVNLGLIPATIAPFILTKISPSIANRYFLTGKRFDAFEALSIGLLNTVLPVEQLQDACIDLLNQILSSAPEAVKETKQLVKEIQSIKPEKFKPITSKLIAEARIGEEGQEGITAFFDKRKPNWVTNID